MLVGLSGIFIGFGEIIGGATFGIFGSKTIKFGRDPIVLLGFIIHILCFYLIFMNLPAAAPLGDTNDPSFFKNGDPIIQKDDPSFTGSGYVSLAIIYAVFATMNWFAPSILSFMGPKLTMFCGAITYTLFIASFLWPQTWLLYLVSVVVGVGAALIWTGQGNYLTLMSDDATMSRNSGIFWAMMQTSMVFGNLFVFFQFRGQDVIDKHTRMIVFSGLTVVSVIGLVVLLFLPRPGVGAGRADSVGSPTQQLLKSIMLFRTKEMLLLSVTFFYTGPAFALFKFVQSLSAACCFFYSSVITLYWHLVILVVFCTAGTLTFCVVEWGAYRKALLNKPGKNFDVDDETTYP
ncbi:Ion channel regulatory protein UNC-93 [Trinorchestia longiramus]|nr:Ion channel regulatory protein UNC-93 [Trinorchestia longiramus]